MAFQGSLEELPLPDIIQLVSVSGKTGAFTLSSASETGHIYLEEGQIVHAEVGELEGEEAVYELAIWPRGDFVFEPGEDSPTRSIEKSNTNLLMEAARRIDEWQVLSKRIPSTRLIPVFTQESSKTSVSFTPQEWALVCKIDERRSIDEIAVGLGSSPFDTCKILYGLITSGLVELKENLAKLNTDRLHEMTVEELTELAGRIHEQARELLANHDSSPDLEDPYRLTRAELEAGRGVDAVLDLVRSEEKVISSTMGPNLAKSFLGRVQTLLEGS